MNNVDDLADLEELRTGIAIMQMVARHPGEPPNNFDRYLTASLTAGIIERTQPINFDAPKLCRPHGITRQTARNTRIATKHNA